MTTTSTVMAEAQDSLNVSDLKENFLECSVCLEHFDQAERRPRLLVNCLHSFCSQCLEQLLKKEGRGQVTCPNCRQVQKVKGNAQSLPVDPVRNKLVDYVKFKKGKKIPCTDCPDGSHAVARCHECQSYMCAPCKEAHHRNRVTRKHTCQSLEEALSEPVKNFLSHRCEDHPDYKIEFFCGQCSSLCCVSCPIVKHRGHILDPIEDAANSMLSSLKTKVDDVEKSASVLRGKKTSLEEKSNMQKVNLKHTTVSINKTFDELIGKFNCQRNKLITQLTERTESTLNGLEKQRQATEDSLAQMESTLEYFKQMESKSDDCEVLSAGPVLVQSLKAAAAVDLTEDVQDPTWTFSPGKMDSVISMVQRTGEIHSDTKYQELVNDMLKEADKDLKCKSSPSPTETPKDSIEDDPMTEHDKYYPDRFLISGLRNKIREETLSDFVEVCSAYEVDKIEYSRDMSKAVVTLKLDTEQKLNTEDWSRLKSEFVKRPLEGSRIVIQRLPVSNKICVWHVHKDRPNLPLRDYFEHPISGNMSNSAVDVKIQDGFSIVTFDSFSVRDCVLSHKPHTLSGHTLVVTAFYDELGPVKQAAQTKEETFRYLSKGEGTLMSRLVDSLKSDYNLQEVTTKDLEVKLKGDHSAVTSAIEKLHSARSEIKQREVICSNLKSEYLNSYAGRKEIIAILDRKGILASWICHSASITIYAFSDRDVAVTARMIVNDLIEGDLDVGRHFDALKDHLEHAFDKRKFLLCRKSNLCFLAHKEIFSDMKSEIDSFLRQKKPKETRHVSLSTEEYRVFEIVMPMSRIRDDLHRRYDVEIQDSGTGLSVHGHEKNVRKACDDLKSQIERDELTLDSKESERFQKVGNHGILFKHIEDTKKCVVKMEKTLVPVTGEDEDLGAVGGSYGSKTESYGSKKRLYGSDEGSHGSDAYFYRKEKTDTGDNGWKPKKTRRGNRSFGYQETSGNAETLHREGEIAKATIFKEEQKLFLKGRTASRSSSPTEPSPDHDGGTTKESRMETQFVLHLYSDTFSRLADGKVTLRNYAGDREIMELVNLPKNVTENEISRSLRGHDVKVRIPSHGILEVKGKPAHVMTVLAVLKMLNTYKNDDEIHEHVDGKEVQNMDYERKSSMKHSLGSSTKTGYGSIGKHAGASSSLNKENKCYKDTTDEEFDIENGTKSPWSWDPRKKGYKYPSDEELENYSGPRTPTKGTAASAEASNSWSMSTERDVPAAPYKMTWSFLDPYSEDLNEYGEDLSRQIEKAYRKGEMLFKLPPDEDGSEYIIDFKTMVEYPKTNPGDVVPILRREEVPEVKSSIPHFPSTWFPMDCQDQIITLKTSDRPFEKVKEHLEITSQDLPVFLVKIEKVQNKDVYERYQWKKKTMKDTDGLVECLLWHPCVSPDSIVPINKHGMNLHFCRPYYGSRLGEGIEFCEHFTDIVESTADRNQYAYLCNVLVGKYTKGKPGMRDPPSGESDESDFYHSVVDDVTKPSRYLVFSDTQVEPQYLITYKLEKTGGNKNRIDMNLN